MEIVVTADETLEFQEHAFPFIGGDGSYEIVTFGLSASATVVKRSSADEFIEFTDTATCRKVCRIRAVEKIIVYTTEAVEGPPPALITVETGVTLTAIASRNIQVNAREHVVFGLSASGPIRRADGIEVSAEEAIEFGLSAPSTQAASAEESVVFGLSADVRLSNTKAIETIVFGLSADCRVIHRVTAQETIQFHEAFTFVIINGCVEKQYTPFTGGGEIASPPDDLPTASGDEGFLLQYPADAPTSEVELRSPNFGNVHRVALDRINRETRGGKLIVFADPIWSKAETLLFTFSALSREQVLSLKDFYRTSLGKEIRLVDHENRAWRGVITQPNDPVVQDGPGCQFTASFEFRGERE